MRHISTTDALAARQHGVVTRAQLLALGWSASRVARERRARRLHELHAGVYAVGHRALGEHGRWMAGALACAGALSRHSAGALHEMPIADNGLTRVTAPTKHRRRRIDCHRAHLHPSDLTVRHGIPVTTVARTLADLAHALDDASLHRVVKDTQYRGLVDEAQITDTLTRKPARRLRHYLSDTTLTQSALEDRFLRLCRRHQLPTPHTQYGTKPRVDFIWHAARVIVEVDGWQAHRTRTAFQDDRSHTNALQLAGYLVLRFTHQDVTHRATLVAAQVHQALDR